MTFRKQAAWPLTSRRAAARRSAFTEPDALLARMKSCRFDAFVIDWVLGEGSASKLLAMIRAEDRQCPIAILTGKLEDDVSIEVDVAAALTLHKLMFFQKPTRLPLLSSQVLRALGADPNR